MGHIWKRLYLTGGSDLQDCSICLNSLDYADWKLSSCGHVLCTSCVQTLEQRSESGQCPVCRYDLMQFVN